LLWLLRLLGFLYPAVAAACLTLLGVMLMKKRKEPRIRGLALPKLAADPVDIRLEKPGMLVPQHGVEAAFEIVA